MRNYMIALTLMLVGCSEAPIMQQYDANNWMEQGDGATQGDAGVDANVDSGAVVERDSGSLPDAASNADAGLDANASPDAYVAPAVDTGVDAGSDAGVDAATGTDAAAPVDAATARPAVVDVTGSRCALDAAGSFYCWGRWSPVEQAHLLGSGYSAASGSCALHGREVWCAEFTSESMVPVIEGSATLVVDTISEYSDLSRGCGTRALGGGWYEAVCWTDGGSVVSVDSGDHPRLVAVSAISPSMVSAIIQQPGYEAYDVNQPATCISDGVRASCTGTTTFGLERPAGDHYILGFAMSCAHQAGRTFCGDGTTGPSAGDLAFSDVGGFHDHAITWPIGSVDSLRPWQARGICIAGTDIRCYDGSGTGVGTLVYTVTF